MPFIAVRLNIDIAVKNNKSFISLKNFEVYVEIIFFSNWNLSICFTSNKITFRNFFLKILHIEIRVVASFNSKDMLPASRLLRIFKSCPDIYRCTWWPIKSIILNTFYSVRILCIQNRKNIYICMVCTAVWDCWECSMNMRRISHGSVSFYLFN